MDFEIPAAIAAALSTVDGVTGHELQPRAPKEGDAWPAWADALREAPGVLNDGWQVKVVLPVDEAAQRAWIAERRWDLIDALTGAGVYVENLASGVAADRPALLINCRE